MLLLKFAALAGVSYGHIALTKPCPAFSPFCETKPALPPGASYDYDIKSPIPYDGPLTKTDRLWPEPVETWTAGEDVTIKFMSQSASHGGGSLAIGLGFTSGGPSVMIFQRLRHAFFNGPSSSNTAEVLEYTFKLPADVPSCDNAVISMVFFNRLGVREMYHLTSNVKITSNSGTTSFTGPQMVIANHAGYPTIPESDDYDIATGVSLFENAPNITISMNGGYSAGGSAPPKYEAPAPSNVQPIASPAPVESPVPSSTAPLPLAPAVPTTADYAGNPAPAAPTYQARVAPIPAKCK
ncbi:hypothetical protein H4S02_002099 [Coemansia sp. RSA 2611]|nr:hypothetical protein H4S01_002433 [Coemansia sp. RSA 2610]KAJ2389974.1 hypothetical protein H4S02_002099 [Coemansia sp. RSA 2611]